MTCTVSAVGHKDAPSADPVRVAHVTDTLNSRKDPTTDYPVLPLLAQRWSPRAIDGDHELSTEEIGSLLEAARWAPSAFNSQPWRFVVARRGDDTFAAITAALTGNNPLWAPKAAILLVVCTLTHNEEGKPLRWAEYDTGQAVAYLTVQAESMGLSVHQMAGFNVSELTDALHLPEQLVPITVTAVGRMEPEAPLPDHLREREVAARVRLPLSDITIAGWD